MADRDSTGRFTVGHRDNGAGRPRELWRKAFHKALSEEYTPKRIIDMLKEAEEIARSTKAAKAIANIAFEVRDTLDGKPVQRVENVESDIMKEFIDDIAAKMKEEEQG